MKKTSLLLIMGVLLVSLAVTAFVTVKADSAPQAALQATVVPSATPTSIPSATPTAFPPPTGGKPAVTGVSPVQSTSMITLWDKVCVKKVAYTILAIPDTASFELVAMDGSIIPALAANSSLIPGQNSCKAVLTIGDKQVLVCTGKQASSFTLRVTSGSATEDFQVPLKACPLKPAQNVSPTDTPVAPTLEPTIVPPTPTP